MLKFNDDELSTVMRYGAVLHPRDRKAYLERVSALLKDVVLGPGVLHRVCAQAQAELREPSAAAAIDGRPHVEEREERHI
jgi:hypothetical protein